MQSNKRGRTFESIPDGEFFYKEFKNGDGDKTFCIAAHDPDGTLMNRNADNDTPRYGAASTPEVLRLLRLLKKPIIRK